MSAKQTTLFGLAQDMTLKQQKAQYWAFVANCHKGQKLKATDRSYQVQKNGAWKFAGFHSTELPRTKSQIFVPHWPSKNRLSGAIARV